MLRLASWPENKGPHLPIMLLDPPTQLERHTSGQLGAMVDLMADLVEAGGPKPEDYAGLNRAIRKLGDEMRAGIVPKEAVRKFAAEITERHLSGTLQGMALAKPHGYSGDFEIIDRIYSLHTTDEPHLRNWDLFFHSQAAPCAVRNRKVFFQQLLSRLCGQSAERSLRVLDVGSGPAREIRDWFLSSPAKDVFFDCVDADAAAIAHARRVCGPFLYHVRLHHQNALRELPSAGYDLVWSAGLFDYLADRVFTRLLRALLAVVKPGGWVVAGNFSDFNPSRDYMEIFGDWHLRHRSRSELANLARLAAGGSGCEIEVRWEPEGVNLFLMVRKAG